MSKQFRMGLIAYIRLSVTGLDGVLINLRVDSGDHIKEHGITVLEPFEEGDARKKWRLSYTIAVGAKAKTSGDS